MLRVGPLVEGLVLVQEEEEEGSQYELHRWSTPTCRRMVFIGGSFKT